jgi:transposase-like protein
MPKSYSADLRRRVIEAVETGASRREAAESFDVDASSAVRWLQCWNETGRCAPKPRGGSVSPLERHAEQILALVAEQSDLIAIFLFCGRPRAVPRRGFQPGSTLAQPIGSTLASTLVVARTYGSPRDEMCSRREPAHVGPDLRDDDVSTETLDPHSHTATRSPLACFFSRCASRCASDV